MYKNNTLSSFATFFCFFLLLAQNTLVAQNCTPTSPITYTYPTDNGKLVSIINANPREYSPEEFAKIRESINNCNNSVLNEIHKVKGFMSSLSQKYQGILNFKDVAGLEKQVRDLEESKRKAEEELEKSMSDIKQTGIYVVLLKNLTGFINPTVCAEKAKNTASPMVVKDLLGEKITRFSQVSSYSLVKDKIESFVSGEVIVEKVLMQKQNNSAKYFLYAAELSATPLKSKPVGNQAIAEVAAIVLNPKIDVDWKNRLKQEGVSDEYISAVEQDISGFFVVTESKNQAQNDLLSDLLQNSNEQIKGIKEQIEKIKNDLKGRSNKIKTACQEFKVSFDASNIDKSVEELLKTIKNNIATQTTEWGKLVAQQIETRPVTNVTIEDDPSKTFATRALELCKQLSDQYSTIDRIQQITEVENFQTTKFDESRKIAFYRTLSRFWVYLIPKEGTFDVYVFAQFDLSNTAVKTMQTTNTTTTTPTKKQETTVYTPTKSSNTTQQSTSQTQQNFTENHDGLGLDMVFVEGGTFQMGSNKGDDDEKPAHFVTVSDFYVGKYEVTNLQFCKFLNEKGNQKDGGTEWINLSGSYLSEKCRIYLENNRYYVENSYENNPVIYVSWHGAIAFCNWLQERANKKYRLPTEAEWEYAARGGKKSNNYTYSGSNTVGDVAQYDGNNNKSTSTVGLKNANELGIYDMSGNVWEWCQDLYGAYNENNPKDPQGASSGSNRVIRGGSWINDAAHCRVADRSYSTPVYSGNNLGFRVILPR